MTLSDIQALLVAADPDIQHYTSRKSGNYSVWRELHRLGTTADDEHEEGWNFQVDRFTKTENDETALRIFTALDQDDRVAVNYQVDYEQDTGYIHHIFDCEAV